MPQAATLTETPDAPPVAPTAAPTGRRGLWLRVGLAVVLLSASAAARSWQARRVDQMLRDGRVSPFALSGFPKQLGPWKGEDQVVDQQTIRTTGSTDSIFRTYQNQDTGERVSMLILFGPCTEMYGHTPEVCYPATGYGHVSGPARREVKVGDSAWPFRQLVYAKGEGGQSEIQEVYYTWRYSGRWTPEPRTHKEFQRIPSMFKVQVQRLVRERELNVLDDGNPCRAILAQIMPELDRRIAAAEAARPKP